MENEKSRVKITFEFHDLDRIVLFSNAENFQVAKDRLFRLGMTIYLDAEKVALVLPIQFALEF
jgi:negative regulator of genetic competence, sporulation and motility